MASPLTASLRSLRVALVHDWLVCQRGGEQVLLALSRALPEAPIYTLICDLKHVHPHFHQRHIVTSPLQYLGPLRPHFRKLLPLFPWCIEQFDLRQYDFILSTSHCVAKGILHQPGQLHLSYIHSPMRYLGDSLPHYLGGRQWAAELLQPMLQPLRQWDRRSSQRPTALVANSHFIAREIKQRWQRQAEVVYPPVDVDHFSLAHSNQPRRGFLVVSALVPYKRVDVAIKWANATGQALTVIGCGTEAVRLQHLAGPTVTFWNRCSLAQLRQAYASHQALLFCGREDFGMVAVEAMATGCPVIACREGGMRESIGDDPATAGGVLLSAPTVAAVEQAVQCLRRRRYSRKQLQKRARIFSTARFEQQLAAVVDRLLEVNQC